jgi:hypothetical protein
VVTPSAVASGPARSWSAAGAMSTQERVRRWVEGRRGGMGVGEAGGECMGRRWPVGLRLRVGWWAGAWSCAVRGRAESSGRETVGHSRDSRASRGWRAGDEKGRISPKSATRFLPTPLSHPFAPLSQHFRTVSHTHYPFNPVRVTRSGPILTLLTPLSPFLPIRANRWAGTNSFRSRVRFDPFRPSHSIVLRPRPSLRSVSLPHFVDQDDICSTQSRI